MPPIRKRKSKIERTLGRVAADTLGYIVGNVPGAAAADILYQKLSNMPNGKRPITGSTPYPKKRKSVPVSKPKSGKRPSGGKRSSKRSVGTDYYGSNRVSGKRASVKKTRVAKIAPPMRMAIKKIINGNDPQGTYVAGYLDHLWYGGTPLYGSNYDNKQKVGFVGDRMFTPQEFMNAAAILFKNKGVTTFSTTYSATNDFLREGFRVNVINSYVADRSSELEHPANNYFVKT